MTVACDDHEAVDRLSRAAFEEGGPPLDR